MARFDRLLERGNARLDAGEQVLAALRGTYETKILGSDSVRGGIFMATQSRLVFYAKKLGGYELKSFPYSDISSLEQSQSRMGGTISFFASGNRVSVKWIDDTDAMQTFFTVVMGNLQGAPEQVVPGADVPQPAATAGSHDDILAKIRQLGELHRAGVLSDEEFTAKKAELLDRI